MLSGALFGLLQSMIGELIQFAGQVLLGTIVFAAGSWLANLAHTGVLRVAGDSAAAREAAARRDPRPRAGDGSARNEIADDITNMAFGLILGAVAVAFAVSFGLGGREAAGKPMEYWLSNLRK